MKQGELQPKDPSSREYNKPADRTPVLNDCNSANNNNNNAGCSVKFDESNSFGPSFNNDGGGWYVYSFPMRSILDPYSVWYR